MRILLVSTLLGFSALGGSAKPSSVQTEIDKALAPMRTTQGVEVELKRRSVNNLLAREKSGEGRLYYRKGKLRVEMKEPDASTLVMDGKTIWLESKLDNNMGGKTMVSKTSAKSFKKSNTLIAALLENKSLLKEFKLKNRRTADGLKAFEFVAKDPLQSEIQTLTVWLKAKSKGLSKIEFTDDKENEVILEFGEAKALDSDAGGYFKYVPPKGAEVTEF